MSGCGLSNLDFTLRMWDFINMLFDWSRTESPGGGAVPVKESVATENASRPTQKTRGDMRPDFSTQLWLCCTHLLLKRHQKPSRNKRYSTEPSRALPTSICVSAQSTFSAMPPVSSAFLMGLPVPILAVLALFDNSLVFLFVKQNYHLI